MTFTDEIPVVRPVAARQAYADLQEALVGRATPCAPEEAIQVGLSVDDWIGDGAHPKAAAKRCREACPVVLECRAYALAAAEPTGVWGGLTATQRSAMIRARRA